MDLGVRSARTVPSVGMPMASSTTLARASAASAGSRQGRGRNSHSPLSTQPVFRLRPDAVRFARTLGAIFFAAFLFRGVRA